MSAIAFLDVCLRRDDTAVLSHVNWHVQPGERWVVLGPNGSGKTTMLQMAGAHLHPTSGLVSVLGNQLGHVDVRELRKRIGLVSGAVTRQLRPQQSAVDVVLTGRHAALETCWDEYTDADRAQAAVLLEQLGIGHIAERTFGVVSEGERQHVLLARALMSSPDLLLLDEPFAGLDLGARERLLDRLTAVMSDPATPPSVLVTHHTEEIPIGITHALMLRSGQIVTAGPIGTTLTSEHLSATFGITVKTGCTNGRWWTRAMHATRAETFVQN